MKVLSLQQIREKQQRQSSPSKRRSHSPVVFDVQGKACVSPPSRPVVAVAARKRPHHEEPKQPEALQQPEEPPTSRQPEHKISNHEEPKQVEAPPKSRRPERKIWRSSRLVSKLEGREEESKPEPASPPSHVSPTRKLRLRKAPVEDIIVTEQRPSKVPCIRPAEPQVLPLSPDIRDDDILNDIDALLND